MPESVAALRVSELDELELAVACTNIGAMRFEGENMQGGGGGGAMGWANDINPALDAANVVKKRVV